MRINGDTNRHGGAMAPAEPPPQFHASPGQLSFGRAEQVLLDEARSRFEFEQKSGVALHSKSTLFLTVAGVLAALLTTSISRLLDRSAESLVQRATLLFLALALLLLTVGIILIGRSAFSRSYQVIATPAHWVQHLANLRLRQIAHDSPNSDDEICARLRYDLMDAWVEAAGACCAVNEAKASLLDRVAKLLYVVATIALLGVMVLLVAKVY